MNGAAAASAELRAAVAGASARFRSRLDDPGAVQADHLRRLLERNAASRFGREHGFADIAGASDCTAAYRDRVPVRDPEAWRPLIDRATGDGASMELTVEPMVACEETGGSSGGRRLVPYTASGLGEFQSGLHAWLDDLYCSTPALAAGSFYWSISPAGRPSRVLPSGLPVGLPSDAAYFGAGLAPAIVASLAVPPEVGGLADIDEWRWQTLVHLLARDDLGLVSVWSPTFFGELLAAAVQERDALAALLARSGLCTAQRVDAVSTALAATPSDFAALWPRLAVISCWDQASARAPAAWLRSQFPRSLVQGKGLLATECLVSLPLHDHPYPVLALESGYFEFREPSGRLRNAAEVEDGGDYELVLSNGSGLYRYAIGDMVRVRGFAGRTPRLEFLGRAGGTDLCGEKLSDAFVAQLLTPLGLRFAALAADADKHGEDGRRPPGYVLLIDADEVDASRAEALRAGVEHGMQRNPQYAYARQLGQLAALSVRRCRQPARRWLAWRMAAGQRLGDIKLPVLFADAAALSELTA